MKSGDLLPPDVQLHIRINHQSYIICAFVWIICFWKASEGTSLYYLKDVSPPAPPPHPHTHGSSIGDFWQFLRSEYLGLPVTKCVQLDHYLGNSISMILLVLSSFYRTRGRVAYIPGQKKIDFLCEKITRLSLSGVLGWVTVTPLAHPIYLFSPNTLYRSMWIKGLSIL